MRHGRPLQVSGPRRRPDASRLLKADIHLVLRSLRLHVVRWTRARHCLPAPFCRRHANRLCARLRRPDQGWSKRRAFPLERYVLPCWRWPGPSPDPWKQIPAGIWGLHHSWRSPPCSADTAATTSTTTASRMREHPVNARQHPPESRDYAFRAMIVWSNVTKKVGRFPWLAEKPASESPATSCFPRKFQRPRSPETLRQGAVTPYLWRPERRNRGHQIVEPSGAAN